MAIGATACRQDRLFYEFNLEERIPPDHLLRRIDAALDLSWLRADLAPFYSHTGCPSVDPELMVRMLLIGYCYSIRSERRLCREVELNLPYRWFCRPGLEDQVPHHSTFSANRHGRFRDSDVLHVACEASACVPSLPAGCSPTTSRRWASRSCGAGRSLLLSICG